MTDKELLERAAKAAGYDVRWSEGATGMHYTGFLRTRKGKQWPNGFDVEVHWNPLANDGDALRLVVEMGLQLSINHDPAGFSVVVSTQSPFGAKGVTECGDDCQAATRRAIVRAAALATVEAL